MIDNIFRIRKVQYSTLQHKRKICCITNASKTHRKVIAGKKRCLKMLAWKKNVPSRYAGQSLSPLLSRAQTRDIVRRGYRLWLHRGSPHRDSCIHLFSIVCINVLEQQHKNKPKKKNPESFRPCLCLYLYSVCVWLELHPLYP